MPKYINKDKFGTVPKYLETRKKQMEEHQKSYDAYVQQRMEKGALNQISPLERYRIILNFLGDLIFKTIVFYKNRLRRC